VGAIKNNARNAPSNRFLLFIKLCSPNIDRADCIYNEYFTECVKSVFWGIMRAFCVI
jgi:hypothetical protein